MITNINNLLEDLKALEKKHGVMLYDYQLQYDGHNSQSIYGNANQYTLSDGKPHATARRLTQSVTSSTLNISFKIEDWEISDSGECVQLY